MRILLQHRSCFHFCSSPVKRNSIEGHYCYLEMYLTDSYSGREFWKPPPDIFCPSFPPAHRLQGSRGRAIHPDERLLVGEGTQEGHASLSPLGNNTLSGDQGSEVTSWRSSTAENYCRRKRCSRKNACFPWTATKSRCWTCASFRPGHSQHAISWKYSRCIFPRKSGAQELLLWLTM